MVVPVASIWRINVHFKTNSVSVSTYLRSRKTNRDYCRKMPLCRGVVWQMLTPKFRKKYFSRRIQCELRLIFHLLLGEIIKHRRRMHEGLLKRQRWSVARMRVYESVR